MRRLRRARRTTTSLRAVLVACLAATGCAVAPPFPDPPPTHPASPDATPTPSPTFREPLTTRPVPRSLTTPDDAGASRPASHGAAETGR